MRRAIRAAVQVFAGTFAPAGPVVELGSRYALGRAALGDLRPIFPGVPYIGSDLRPGPGVDRVEDAQALSFEDGSAGVVLALEVLEHLPAPHVAVAEARRVLTPEGLLVVSVPFAYRIHGAPADYWRFTANGVAVLLRDFPARIVVSVGPAVKPAFVFAVACKAGSRGFDDKRAVFRAGIEDLFRRTRWRGRTSVMKERSRDLFGFLLGRADLSVRFLDD